MLSPPVIPEKPGTKNHKNEENLKKERGGEKQTYKKSADHKTGLLISFCITSFVSCTN